jgi:hypothetical protein
MKEKVIHQWRDWVLEYIGEGKYELIQKENSSVRTITAKNDMDAENQCQQIIKKAKSGFSPEQTDGIEA